MYAYDLVEEEGIQPSPSGVYIQGKATSSNITTPGNAMQNKRTDTRPTAPTYVPYPSYTHACWC